MNTDKSSQLLHTPDYNGSLVVYKVLKFIKFQFYQIHGQNLAWNQNERSYFTPKARTSPLQFNLVVLRFHVNNCPQLLPLRSWTVYVTTSCKHISFFVKYWLPILNYFNNKLNKAENQTGNKQMHSKLTTCLVLSLLRHDAASILTSPSILSDVSSAKLRVKHPCSSFTRLSSFQKFTSSVLITYWQSDLSQMIMFLIYIHEVFRSNLS